MRKLVSRAVDEVICCGACNTILYEKHLTQKKTENLIIIKLKNYFH